MRGASPVDQTGGALFFSLVPISVEKGKQCNEQTAKGNQQADYPKKNHYDFICRHMHHLPSYVFRRTGFIGSGGYHPVMGTLPRQDYSIIFRFRQYGIFRPEKRL